MAAISSGVCGPLLSPRTIDGEGEIGAGDAGDAAVSIVIHDREAAPEGSFQRKRGGTWAGVEASLTPMSRKPTPCLASGGDETAGVAGNVGHFGAGGDAAEAAIERLREGEAAFDHGGAQHLGLPGEGQCVPGDIAARDGLLHGRALGGGGLFKVFVEQPRTGGPDIAALALGVGGASNLDGVRESTR